MHIDKIYYINLDRRPDRDKNIQNELIKAKLNNHNISKIRAYDGSKLDINKIPNELISNEGKETVKSDKKHYGISLTMGAIGCALSHRLIWEKIKNDPQIKTALILEDDITIDPDFLQKYNEVMKNLIKFDVVFLGYHPSSIGYIKNRNSNDIFLRTSKIYGLFGYIMTKEGAKKSLEMFPLTQQIDSEFAKIINNNYLDAYVIRPNMRLIASQPSEIATKFGSDIQLQEKLKIKNKEKFSSNRNSEMFDMMSFCLILLIFCLFVILLNVLFELTAC